MVEQPLPPAAAPAIGQRWRIWLGRSADSALSWLTRSAAQLAVVALALGVGGGVAATAALGFWHRPPALDIERAMPDAVPLSLPPPSAAAAGVAATGTPGGGEIVVHVAGAVVAPKVVTLPADARVADAVAAAGGLAADADGGAVNLAEPLRDGVQVFVPRLGEVAAGGVRGGAAAGTGEQPAEPVDLNQATAAELDALPGVGPATAAAIVEHRTRNGPFTSVDDLDAVPGIGTTRLERLRDLVTV